MRVSAYNPRTHERSENGAGHARERGGATRGPAPLPHPRYRAGTQLRRPDAAGVAHLRHADGAHLPGRRRPPVVQVAHRHPDQRDGTRRLLLRPRHQPPRSLHRPRRPARRTLPRQSARHRRSGNPLLCRRAAGHARRTRARHPVRAGSRRANALARAAGGVDRALPPDRGAARAAAARAGAASRRSRSAIARRPSRRS